jgi:PAS domain S-box-containing protein
LKRQKSLKGERAMETARKIRTLSIDDDPDFLPMLGKLINREFPSMVDTAFDCASARDAFGATVYDLFTIDYQLPDGNGLELLGEIMARNHNPMAIMVTGQGDEKIAARAFQLGAAGYVVKDNRIATMFRETLNGALALQRTQKILNDSETRYRRLFEAAKDGILILEGETGKIIDANPYLLDMLGYSLDELLDKELWEIGPFKDSPATRSAVIEVQKKSYIRYEDLPLETRAGEIVDVEFVCNLYASGAANVIQCNIRDIRKRKLREDREKLRTEDLDHYARTVSHDLRSPLASIGLTADLLEARLKELPGAEGDEEAAVLIESIKKNTDKAHDLITSLLSLAEIGLVSGNVETVDVGAVVGDILEEYKVVLTQKDTRVQVGKDLGELVASPSQIRQVFANLIGNAIEYAHNEDTVIEVAYIGEDANGGRRYMVRDNGPGIPENLLGSLFLPFVSQKGKGKGLGLAIVYTVVRAYGGSVRAYNDHGACIEFSLKDLSPNAERT